MCSAALLVAVVAASTARAQAAAELDEALRVFKFDAPWNPLSEAAPFVRDNRGAAAHLASLLKSAGVEPKHKAQIRRDFAALKAAGDSRLATAQSIDRERGAYYRDQLKFDVLRLLVTLLSEGRESFHFSAQAFQDAYFSRAEGRHQMFQVRLPANYSPRDRVPLFVQVFGSDSLKSTDARPFIRVRPSGRGVWGYRSMSRYDVMQVVRLMKARYGVDADRVYLSGVSAGATGAMHAAALRQDVFAGVVPLVAFGNDLPLENFRNLPLRCEHGVNDWTSAIGNVRVQFQKLARLQILDAKLNEHPRAGHGIRVPPPATMDWLFRLKRDSQPERITHHCEHPRDGRAYWLSIDALIDPHQLARVDAKRGASVEVTTENVRRLTIDWSRAADGGSKLVVDGVALPVDAASRTLVLQKDDAWRISSVSPAATRRTYAAGAASNLFQGEPLLVVYGTNASPERQQFLRRAAGLLARCGGPQFKSANVRFPVIADTSLSDWPIEHYNLLLVGSPQDHRYLAKLTDKLPYQVRDGQLVVGNRSPLPLAGGVLALHYFNPEHPARMIYIVSPYLTGDDATRFLANPRKHLAGSEGFKMIDQPDLRVRGADLRLRREMQFDADWQFPPSGDATPAPERFRNREALAQAHMNVMCREAKADLALWWGPNDKGIFGGYDFNWLPNLDPRFYTRADYLVRRRETETMTAELPGRELQEIHDRWMRGGELICRPAITRAEIDADRSYRVVLPMDLVPKLGQRRKTLRNVAPGPDLMPTQIAAEVFRTE